MANLTDSSSNDEMLIQQRLQEFRQIAQKYEKAHPRDALSFDPGSDPIAKEAVLRLMEESIEQALVQSTGQALDPEDLQRIKQELREEVNRLHTRGSTE